MNVENGITPDQKNEVEQLTYEYIAGMEALGVSLMNIEIKWDAPNSFTVTKIDGHYFDYPDIEIMH